MNCLTEEKRISFQKDSINLTQLKSRLIHSEWLNFWGRRDSDNFETVDDLIVAIEKENRTEEPF